MHRWLAALALAWTAALAAHAAVAAASSAAAEGEALELDPTSAVVTPTGQKMGTKILLTTEGRSGSTFGKVRARKGGDRNAKSRHVHPLARPLRPLKQHARGSPD